MVKIKPHRTAHCVVGGFRYLSNRPEVGSLLLGLYDDAGRLNHVGFTATIANAERADLMRRLAALREPLHRQRARRPQPVEHRAQQLLGAFAARARG